MSQPLLVLDCHYLCHRAFHSAGHLSWKGRPTGVIFSFLKSIFEFKQEFYTDKIAFCFEGNGSLRKDIYPTYKHRRNAKERSEEEVCAHNGLVDQIRRLRKEYLPHIGFKNVFAYDGYESDDIMAVLAFEADPSESVILLTSDHDLFQCLAPNVSIFSPQQGKLFTEDWFRRTYGLAPRRWAFIKAIAGCKCDNVEGVKGVGEKTAIRFARGTLPPESKGYRLIKSEKGKAVILRNRQLVQLPFDSCPTPRIQEDEVSRSAWVEVCAQLGMKSLAGRPPVGFGRKAA